ncbi:MAG: hypothetical protein ACPGOV_03995 [Magnetovibrionaceae bacterium]
MHLRAFCLFSILMLAVMLATHAQPALADGHGAKENGKMPSKILTVVTSPDHQTQAMAFILTLQALKNGAEAQVLLCGPAGQTAVKGVEQAPLKPKGMTPAKLMMAAQKQGAKVQVCALFLPNAGLDAGALAEGVTAARPPEIGAVMADPAVRYFTF